MSTHSLDFEPKYENKIRILSENFQVLVVKISIYLDRRVFVIILKELDTTGRFSAIVCLFLLIDPTITWRGTTTENVELSKGRQHLIVYSCLPSGIPSHFRRNLL